MKPLCVFHVRPERRSRLSVAVEVYRTVGDLRDAVRAENGVLGLGRYRTRGIVGECAGVTVRMKRTRRRTGLFAVVRFATRHLTMSTITHEAFHATMRWAERRKIGAIPTTGQASNITSPRRVASLEERAATVHDTICRRIVVECTRRRLLPS